MNNTNKDSDEISEHEKTKKASDSKDKHSESEEEVFTQDDFETALRRVSRRICEPDEETT